MHPHDRHGTSPVSEPVTAGEVFRAFLTLGFTSFGGPIAHVGYMRRAFVERRQWLDEAQFAQLLAVCQFLPGPASSQMGFAIGLFRAGWRGALAAFLGFTLPSALLMFAFAAVAHRWGDGIGMAGALHGLKLVAVAVVAHGLFGMARSLAPDLARALMAAGAAALVVVSGNPWMQVAAIAGGALLGLLLCRHAKAPSVALFPVRHGPHAALLLGGMFLLGLALAFAWPTSAAPTLGSLAAGFYRAGALVFGGGHVVLPLLQHGVVDSGWMGADTFLAGYGAAQAVPGPMFTLAAYLGAAVPLPVPPAVGALVALLAVFAPGFLLLVAMLPVWSRLARHPNAARAIAGVNAAVVGLLAAAFYDPVLTQGVHDPSDIAIAAVGVVLMARGRASALAVVAWCVAASVAVAWAA